MPTKNEIKFIKSLKQKKSRQQNHVFVAEGEKLVRHFLEQGQEVVHLLATDDRIQHQQLEVITATEMKAISQLQNPSPALAVFKQPVFPAQDLNSPFVLVLDGVRDPGNLGTILRLCDWFGVSQMICTDDCVDVFNEKVVQASMGSVTAVRVFSMSRPAIIHQLNKLEYVMVSTRMDAPSIYEFDFPLKSALVLGNEGQGVSVELSSAANNFVSIPSAPNAKAESLNVASATAICLSELFRRA